MKDIRLDVRQYILENLCSQDQASELTDETPLLSSGIIDSISALELVEFLEDKYSIEFQAHEVDQDNLDSVARIESFILTKSTT